VSPTSFATCGDACASSSTSAGRGYGAFSVSPYDCQKLVRYIQGQEEHHRARTFQEEYREILVQHKVEFDERYLW